MLIPIPTTQMGSAICSSIFPQIFNVCTSRQLNKSPSHLLHYRAHGHSTAFSDCHRWHLFSRTSGGHFTMKYAFERNALAHHRRTVHEMENRFADSGCSSAAN